MLVSPANIFTPLQPIASWWGDPVGYVEHGKLAGFVADQEPTRCQRFRQWPEWCHYKTSELESIMINYDHIVSVLHCVACVLFGCPLLGVHMLKLWFSHKIIWGSPVGLLKICLSTLSVSIWIQSCFGDPVRVQGSRAQSVAWERDRGTKAKCQARGADQWPITLMAQVATGVMLVNKPPI